MHAWLFLISSDKYFLSSISLFSLRPYSLWNGTVLDMRRNSIRCWGASSVTVRSNPSFPLLQVQSDREWLYLLVSATGQIELLEDCLESRNFKLSLFIKDYFKFLETIQLPKWFEVPSRLGLQNIPTASLQRG